MFNDIVQFSFPTTILFGRGAICRLPDCLGELNVRKPLIVTDEGLAEAGLVNRVTTVLQTVGMPCGVFSGVRPDPRIEDVNKGVASFRADDCDGVIGFGGGSSLDVAKVIPVLATQDGPLTRYDILTGGNKDILGPLPPLILIPTTSGSGSEVGRCSVIIDSTLSRKFLVCHPLLLAKRAILDPELTIGLPPLLTASTGIDAFAHNLESLVSLVFHPMCDAIALKGIEFVARYLERAVNNPTDLEARGFMMLAAMMGAVAFQKDLGATHSLAHALSSVCSIPHGLAIAMCLVPVMIFNQAVSAAGYAQVARYFGIETVGLSDREASAKLIQAVADLIPRLGLPRNLAAAGVDEGRLAYVARKAFDDPCHQTNPRPCTIDDLHGLLRAAYGSA